MATNQVAAMNGVRNSYRITGRFGVETSWFAWASAGTRPHRRLATTLPVSFTSTLRD